MIDSTTGSFSATTVGIAITPYHAVTPRIATVINMGVTANDVWLGYTAAAATSQGQTGLGAGKRLASGASIDMSTRAGEQIWAATATGTQTIDVVSVVASPMRNV